jgi:hypothetical protein
MDIPFRYSNKSDADVVDILVDGLRDSLAELCGQSPEEGQEALEYFLANIHLIFQRIAIYTLRVYGQQYSYLVEKVLSQTHYMDMQEYSEEYKGLLRDQFNFISKELQDKIIAYILLGPRDLEERVARLAKWQNVEITGINKNEIRERWILQHLTYIKDYLYGENLSTFKIYAQRHGEPSIEETPRNSVTSFIGTPSPLTAEELSSMGFEEIKNYFLTYAPMESTLNSREGLARILQSLVSNDPLKFSGLASFFLDPSIRLIYIYHYLSGIKEAIRTKDYKIDEDILNLAEYVVELRKDPFEDALVLHEPGLLLTQLEVAHLLNNVVQKNTSHISESESRRVIDLLIQLTHNIDPKKEDEKKYGLDQFTHSMNCVRGEAMHGIFKYLFNKSRETEIGENNYNDNFIIEPQILAVLEERLDFSNEVSPAIRSVYGAYLTDLFFLDNEWVLNHLDKIFPEVPEHEIYWKAAWDGYAYNSFLFDEIFLLLIPHYQRFLNTIMPSEKASNNISGIALARSAIHIMTAYLRGLTDFGYENHILDLFFDNASDQIRAQAIFWLSKVLEDEKSKENSDLWQRCWKLWQTRLEKAETEEVSKNEQEISDYMRWLVSAPMTLDQLYKPLKKSIKYFQDRFDVMQLLDYAVEYCEQSPLEAVSLLRQTISSAKELWWRVDEKVEENILRAAMTSGDDKAREIAINVINLRGEQGDYQWRELLDLK